MCVWFEFFHLSELIWSYGDGHLTQPRFYLGKLDKAVNQFFVRILLFVTDNNPSRISGKRRMTVELISWSIPTKVWDQA